MTPNKVRRCRRIISTPGYWERRAFEMAEISADYEVESFIHLANRDGRSANKAAGLRLMYRVRMLYYKRKMMKEINSAYKEKECEKYDYET